MPYPPAQIEEDEVLHQRLEAVLQRDGASLLSIKVERRTPSEAAGNSGLVALETFVFVLELAGATRQSVRLRIDVTADLAAALAEERLESADMLVAAWTELSTIADQLSEAACRGGVEAERSRRAALLHRDDTR